MAQMFVNYSKSVAAFKAAGLETTYNNSIVFIGDGEAVYTHGKYYGNVKDALAAVQKEVNELKYFSSIKAGDVTATATGKDGVITFNPADPAEVTVTAGTNGVNIGLSSEFTGKVTKVISDLATETERATTAEGKISQSLGASTDTASAEGSAYARIAQLKADINAMTGGNGSISEQINTAIGNLDSEKEGASAHVTVKVTEEDGKLTAVAVSESDIASAALLGTAEDAATANTAFGKAAAAAAAAAAAKTAGETAASTAESNAKTYAKEYADGLASNYDAAGAAADALADAKEYADGLVGTGSALEVRVKANEDALGVLKGEGDGSVKKAVADGIAGVIASAPEDFDTLKEIADWIGTDTTGAAQMQADIATLKGADTVDGSVAKTVKDAVLALDATVGSQTVAEGKHVAVEVVETDGKLTGLTVVESDIASASGVQASIEAEQKTRKDADDALAGRLTVIEGEGEGSIKKAVSDAQTTLQGNINTLSGTVASNKTAADTGIQAAKDAASAAQGTANANKTAIEAMDLDEVTGFVTSIKQVDGKVTASAVQNIAAEKITVADAKDYFATDVTNVEAALAALAEKWIWEEL